MRDDLRVHALGEQQRRAGVSLGGEARDPEHRDMTYGEENLTPIQHRAIIALIEQPTVAEAAKVAAGCL
jgi:hypothetical protein